MSESRARTIVRDAVRVCGAGVRARTASLAHASVWTLALTCIAIVTVATWPSGRIEPTGAAPEVACWVMYSAFAISALLASAYSSGRLSYSRDLSVSEWLEHTPVSPAGLVLGKLADAWFTSAAFLISVAPFLVVALEVGTVGIDRVVQGLIFIALMLVPFSVAGLAARVLIDAKDLSALALDAYLLVVLVVTAFLPGAWADLNPVVALARAIGRASTEAQIPAGARVAAWIVPLASHGSVSAGLWALMMRVLSRRHKGGG